MSSNLPPMPFGTSEDLDHVEPTEVTFGMRELVHKSNPGHVRVQVFVGRGRGARGNSGELTVRRNEWEEWCEQVADDDGSIAEYVDILPDFDQSQPGGYR